MSATHWTDKLQMCGLFHWQQLWLIGGPQLSRAHSTISKVLIKSFWFWPGEEFLDCENLEYCRLPKNFEFMIVVFYIKYAIIVLKLGSVAFKFWIVNFISWKCYQLNLTFFEACEWVCDLYDGSDADIVLMIWCYAYGYKNSII